MGLWNWLSDPANQRTLGFLGGGLATVVGGLWAVYKHFHGKPGVIFVTTPDLSRKEFKQLAGQLAVKDAALKSFFKIMEQQRVAPEDLDSTLRTIAQRYKDLEAALARVTSEDRNLIETKTEVRQALEKGDFDRAESLLKRASDRDQAKAKEQQALANEHLLAAAASLAEIAQLKRVQLAYTEAANCYREAMDLAPPTAKETRALYLDELGSVSWLAGDYASAEMAFSESLALRENLLGSDHEDTATSMNHLAGLYRAQGKYSEAKALYQRALEIREKLFGLQNPSTGETLNDLALLYSDQGDYVEAQRLYEEALAIATRTLSPEAQETATILNNLAGLYRHQGMYSQAQDYYQRALTIRRKLLGSHPDTAQTMNNLAVLYESQGKYSDAESLCTQALEIREKLLGSNHPDTATTLNTLAEVYRAQEQYGAAEDQYRRALEIREQVLGPQHPRTTATRTRLKEVQTYRRAS